MTQSQVVGVLGGQAINLDSVCFDLQWMSLVRYLLYDAIHTFPYRTGKEYYGTTGRNRLDYC